MSSDALTAANRNATAGFQVAEGQEYLIRGVGRLGDVAAIGAVAGEDARGAVPVLVRDLGAVRDGRGDQARRWLAQRATRRSSSASRSSPASTRSS